MPKTFRENLEDELDYQDMDLSVLSDDSIEKLQIMIHALAENKK